MINTEPDITATISRPPVGCRYRADRVDLLDSISKRLGHPDRASTIRYALDRLVEEHFPGAIETAAAS